MSETEDTTDEEMLGVLLWLFWIVVIIVCAMVLIHFGYIYGVFKP